MAHVLVVDDESMVRTALDELLRHHGHTVELADTGESGVERYARRPADVVILDLTMPGISGVETLARIQQHDPNATAIFLSAYGTVRSAVEAIRMGGFNFLTKPFDNDELMLTVNRALEFRGLHQRVARLEEDVEARASFPGLIGRSQAIREVLRTLAKVAPQDTDVLLLGESGTGKELAAMSLHRQSRRAHHPLVTINCAAIASSLAEDELFGHDRGAFTDARESRAGRFEQAQHGTLFLDEVAELHQDTQAKLLRVLQEREVSRLGGRQPIPVDVRVVAATNRDLERAVKEGLFREDLYWRLSGFSVCMPPLRDRRDDVPLLIDHFLDRLNVKLGLKVNGVSPDARIRLMAHDWPGNVRELESVLQRAMIMMDGSTIQAADLPINVGRRPGTSSPPTDGEPVLPGTMEEVVARAKARVEDALIEATMAQFGGNQTRTAEALGIGRRTLYNKLKRSSWALRPEDKSDDD